MGYTNLIKRICKIWYWRSFVINSIMEIMMVPNTISIMLWMTNMKIHYTQNWYTWRQLYSTNGMQCARDCRGQKWHNQEPLINESTLNYPQLSHLPSTTLTLWWILFFMFLSISSLFQFSSSFDIWSILNIFSHHHHYVHMVFHHK